MKIEENIKALCHWPFWGNSPVTGEFPAQRASDADIFPFDDFIMMQSGDPCNTANHKLSHTQIMSIGSLIARFMGPTLGPSVTDRTQVGPMLAPWTLLSGFFLSYPAKMKFYAEDGSCVKFWNDWTTISSNACKQILFHYIGWTVNSSLSLWLDSKIGLRTSKFCL